MQTKVIQNLKRGTVPVLIMAVALLFTGTRVAAMNPIPEDPDATAHALIRLSVHYEKDGRYKVVTNPDTGTEAVVDTTTGRTMPQSKDGKLVSYDKELDAKTFIISFQKGPQATYTYDAPNHRDRVFKTLKEQWEQTKKRQT